jgi:flagellar motility protein MotE (MotC chaperone)
MLDRLRLLPIVILCASLLLGLKLADLATGGAGTRSFAAIAVAQAETPEAETPETETSETETPETEASETETSETETSETETPDTGVPASAEGDETTTAAEGAQPADSAAPDDPRLSKAELSVLESLAARRVELQKRAETLDMREQILVAAEKRVEDRIAELKEIEQKINAQITEIDEAQEEKMAGLVSMYEGMKPKDAARIFERLDMGVLLDVVKRMQPRKMSAVLAAMDPVVAQDLTVELATGDRLIDTPPLHESLGAPAPEAGLSADKNAS